VVDVFARKKDKRHGQHHVGWRCNTSSSYETSTLVGVVTIHRAMKPLPYLLVLTSFYDFSYCFMSRDGKTLVCLFYLNNVIQV